MRGHDRSLRDELLGEDCYWVMPGQLLAGSHPGPGSLFGSEHKLRRLIQGGVNCFLDLTAPGEAHTYAELADTLAAELGRGPVRYLRRPLTEHGVPTIEEMQGILDELDGALEDGLWAFVHCHYGVGRTGMVVGCWLIRHGIVGGEDVLYHIEQLRAGLNSPWKSPNVLRQRRWVSAWPAGT
ncbi:MAG: hypothetical protein ACE5LU_03015 [Anaerolineae bacterium]